MRRSLLAVLFAIGVGTSHAHADDAPEVIMKHALERDALGLSGGHATVTMTIGDEDGATESRAFEVWSKRSDSTLRTVIRFAAPAKIAGMAFLFVQQKGKPDEQWVYLPAYKKTRRISVKERTASFAGSDFTYADLERREVSDAAYKKLADDDIGKDKCTVIDATPSATISAAYAHVTTWLRKGDDVPLRTQFFASDGKLEKTLFSKKLKTIDGRVVVTLSRMERAASKRFTEVSVDAISWSVDAPDSMFTEGALAGG